MSRFETTVDFEGYSYKVKGTAYPYRAATLEDPAEGGVEEIEDIQLLAGRKPVDLPEFLNDALLHRLDKWGGNFIRVVEESLAEDYQQDKADAAEAKLDSMEDR